MEKVWEIKEKKYEDVITQILYNRGLFVFGDKNIDKIKSNFLMPDFQRDLHDPYLLLGMREAVERIKKAVESNEVVGIFADYDADGIPGAALLSKVLKQLGLKFHTYIPNREGGYGLSENGINFLIEKKCTLIITVDLGIKNYSEAKYCHKMKVDLIVTDHHLPEDKVPDCHCVINPKLAGNNYPFQDLCGCGVVFKLAQALSKEFPARIDEAFLKWNLDLVAISTIADVVSLVGENRVLAKYGLIVLSKTKNIGLQELMKVANIDLRKMDAYMTGFQIAPRINAPGRMDHATKSYELLICEDSREATELAMWLNEKNDLRQKAMSQIYKQIEKEIIDSDMTKNHVLLLSGKWLKGIIGPTASKIVERFYKPTILFAEDEDKFVGSARSVEGVNIVELLKKTEKYIYKFGGHKGAAGITVMRKDFIHFTKEIIKIAASYIDSKSLVKKIKVDTKVSVEDLSLGLYEKILQLEPFGLGNQRPIFLIESVNFSDLKYVGAEKNHASFKSVKDGICIKSILFNCEEKKKILAEKNTFDIVFSLDLDTWGNQKKIQLNIVDIK